MTDTPRTIAADLLHRVRQSPLERTAADKFRAAARMAQHRSDALAWDSPEHWPEADVYGHAAGLLTDREQVARTMQVQAIKDRLTATIERSRAVAS